MRRDQAWPAMLLLQGFALGCGPAPRPVPSPRALEEAEVLARPMREIGLELVKVNGVCTPRFQDTNQKKMEIRRSDDGAFWLVKNTACDQAVEFRIRAVATADPEKKRLPKYCEQTVAVPGDVDMGDTLLVSCSFPRKDKEKYKGVFQYTVQVCVSDTDCVTGDPELDVKRG